LKRDIVLALFGISHWFRNYCAFL